MPTTTTDQQYVIPLYNHVEKKTSKDDITYFKLIKMSLSNIYQETAASLSQRSLKLDSSTNLKHNKTTHGTAIINDTETNDNTEIQPSQSNKLKINNKLKTSSRSNSCPGSRYNTNTIIPILLLFFFIFAIWDSRTSTIQNPTVDLLSTYQQQQSSSSASSPTGSSAGTYFTSTPHIRQYSSSLYYYTHLEGLKWSDVVGENRELDSHTGLFLFEMPDRFEIWDLGTLCVGLGLLFGVGFCLS
ncbi:unnamed protein product [Ambrosiozyma monospora]|uniref:Unnamed protein product n=1 Tax=Ambrosiozyma monospora TaxID=43982 RepID=A0A9W7DHN5_AMBMO|nr:unnamed protein product [Ambrosiozyma monospora]